MDTVPAATELHDLFDVFGILVIPSVAALASAAAAIVAVWVSNRADRTAKSLQRRALEEEASRERAKDRADLDAVARRQGEQLWAYVSQFQTGQRNPTVFYVDEDPIKIRRREIEAHFHLSRLPGSPDLFDLTMLELDYLVSWLPTDQRSQEELTAVRVTRLRRRIRDWTADPQGVADALGAEHQRARRDPEAHMKIGYSGVPGT